MIQRIQGRFFAVLLATLLLSGVACADTIVSLEFNPTTQSVEQGGLLTFMGTIRVTGDSIPIFLNGDSFGTSPGFGLVGLDTPDPALLMLDDLAFLLNAPFTMSSDDSNGPGLSTFGFFTLAVGSLVTPGAYIGTFNLLGGTTSDAQDILASAHFQVDVAAASTPSPVPEPGTLTLLSTGIIGVGAILRRKYRRS